MALNDAVFILISKNYMYPDIQALPSSIAVAISVSMNA